METVCGICNTVRNNSKNGISFHNILSTLRKEFRKKDLDIKVKSQRSKKLLSEEFYINAYYDAEDDFNKETPIEVVIHHNFPKEHVWDQKHTTEFLTQIFDAVVHEYKHQRQSRRRNYKQYWEHIDIGEDFKAYLQDPDELDAYAFSIAIELCRSLGKYRALNYMSRFSVLGKLKFKNSYVSPNLWAYISYFGQIDNPTTKLLAKKVYVRLQKVDADVIFM